MEQCSSFWFLIGYILGFVFYYIYDYGFSVGNAIVAIRNRFIRKSIEPVVPFYDEYEYFDSMFKMMDTLYTKILNERKKHN